MKWQRTLLITGVLAAMLLGVAVAGAHTREGTWVVQGAASVSSSTGDLYGNQNRTQFTMSPGVHYFVIDKLALGLRAPVETFHQGNQTNTSLFVGPSVQYYFGDVDATTNPYLGAGVFLRSLSNKYTNPNGVEISDTRSGSSIAFTGGVALFLREYLALAPELSINLESLEGTTGTTINFGVSLAGFLY